jgi:hypothetical protein
MVSEQHPPCYNVLQYEGVVKKTVRVEHRTEGETVELNSIP